MKIAVDAMGGDYAPEAVVEGTIQAAEEYGFSLILVGQEDRVSHELAKYKTDHLSIEVKHAPEVVDMHDLPSVALRRKKESSLHAAINMIKNADADAAISAGNTGAAMAIGKVACRVLEGVERPALATVLPNIEGITIMIDVGANVDCKPLHLIQFAVMGHVYAQEVFGIQAPRIGVLSVGEEASKGNVLTKETFEALSLSPLNFVGNAEGRDVFNGRVDVIVCDGFIGNVVLKASESLAKAMGLLIKDAFVRNWRAKLGYLLAKPGIEAMRKRVDYSEYGGAPLLGLNGVVIVSHGSSKARAIKNAIRVAGESVNHHLNDQIIEMMAQCGFDTKSRSKATSLWRQLTRTIRHEPHKEKDESERNHEEHSQNQEPMTEPMSEHQEKDEESEHGKRSWWHLKQRGEHRHEEPSAAIEEEDTQPENTDKSLLPPEQHVSEDSQDTEKENESDRKHWWQLKQRGEEKLDGPPQEPLQDMPQLQQSGQSQKSPEDSENSHEHVSSKELDTTKKFWWKRKEATHQKDDMPDMTAGEEDESTEMSPPPQQD